MRLDVERRTELAAPPPRTDRPIVAASSPATSVPSEAAISDALASRKSPARIAVRLPHRAFTLSTVRRVTASSMTSSWYSDPRWTSSTATPPQYRIVADLRFRGTRPAADADREQRANALAAGDDQVARDLGQERRPRSAPRRAIRLRPSRAGGANEVRLRERRGRPHADTLRGLSGRAETRSVGSALEASSHDRANRRVMGRLHATEPRQGRRSCSNVLPTGLVVLSFLLKKKHGCSITTTSAPSTSCSGLIHEGEGVAAKALESLGISLEAVRSQVEEIIGQGGSSPSGHIPFTPRAKKVLELSLREALQLGHNYIGTEHILLGLIREGEGVAAQVLVKLGADLSRVRQQVIQLLSGYSGPGGQQEKAGATDRRQRRADAVGLARPRPVRPQPDAAGAREEARPGHRSPPRDRARDAGPVAPYQEQPGARR